MFATTLDKVCIWHFYRYFFIFFSLHQCDGHLLLVEKHNEDEMRKTLN